MFQKVKLVLFAGVVCNWGDFLINFLESFGLEPFVGIYLALDEVGNIENL